MLLSAYWDEFQTRGAGAGAGLDHEAAGGADVVLRLRTYKPWWEPGSPDLNSWLQELAAKRGKRRGQLPPVELIQHELSREELRWLYAVSDAFVLPSRGEGWGLPVVEAMAMELPVVVTNATAMTTYLTAENSYPLPYTKELPDGKVEPSSRRLRQLMRQLFREHTNANAAAGGNGGRRRGKRATKKGRVAREDIIRRFGPDRVAMAIVRRLRQVRPSMNHGRGFAGGCNTRD